MQAAASMAGPLRSWASKVLPSGVIPCGVEMNPPAAMMRVERTPVDHEVLQYRERVRPPWLDVYRVSIRVVPHVELTHPVVRISGPWAWPSITSEHARRSFAAIVSKATGSSPSANRRSFSASSISRKTCRGHILEVVGHHRLRVTGSC